MSANSYPTPGRRCSEVGYTVRPTNGPTMTGASDQTVFVYFWALGFSIYNSSEVEMGGAHIGPQWVQVGQTDFHGRINFGVYDGFYGGGAVCRGTYWPAALGFDPTTGNYDFPYGTTFKFRVARSPKQNWLAAELDAGSGQSAPYVGTNQQASEVAYRMWMKRDSGPWLAVRDCLVKNAASNKEIGAAVMFTEYIPYTAGVDAFPGHPTALFRDLIMDGQNCAYEFLHTYPAGATHSNATNTTSDGYGWIQHEESSTLTRTTPDNSSLAMPSSFHDTPPASSGPAPVVGGATPRPWWPTN